MLNSMMKLGPVIWDLGLVEDNTGKSQEMTRRKRVGVLAGLLSNPVIKSISQSYLISRDLVVKEKTL